MAFYGKVKAEKFQRLSVQLLEESYQGLLEGVMSTQELLVSQINPQSEHKGILELSN